MAITPFDGHVNSQTFGLNVEGCAVTPPGVERGTQVHRDGDARLSARPAH